MEESSVGDGVRQRGYDREAGRGGELTEESRVGSGQWKVEDGAVVVGGIDHRVLGWLDARDKKNVRLMPVTEAMLK